LTDKLILVEGKDDVEILIKNMTSETKIICFDFESHKYLVDQKIKHYQVEEYISNEDELKIDTKALEFTTKWYKHSKLKKEIEYNGINLGNLVEIELIGYFFKHVKRVVGIIKIVEKEKPNEIFASFLGNFTEVISKDVKINKYKSKKISSLFFDSIEIPIRFRDKIILIKMSRKNFHKFKKIISKIINWVYRLKPNFNQLNLKKSILLLDYNPSLYEEIIKELSKSKHNVLLLNQRRPAIWNLSSLHILKNSNCKIIELNDFLNIKLQKKIKKEQKELNGKLKGLWKNDDLFNEIFIIDGHYIWKAIKENFSILITKRFVEAVERSILLHELFEKIDICSILEWAHVGLEEKLIISIANKRKIPNMFLQHALYLQNEKFDKYIPILPILPSEGSKHVVWGEILENFIIKHGAKKEEIIKIGSPRHDKVFKNRHKEKSNIVLLAITDFYRINCKGTDTKTFIKTENMVRKIFEVVKKYPEKEIIVKLHPTGNVSFDIKPLIKEIDSSIKVFQSENILDLLEKSDVMISLNYSTVILDALTLQKPTLVLLPEEQNYENEIMLKDGAALFTTDVNEIEKNLKILFNDEKVRNNLISKGNKFVNNYIGNQGTASKKLAKILEDYG
jgi:hypothetical protein